MTKARGRNTQWGAEFTAHKEEKKKRKLRGMERPRQTRPGEKKKKLGRKKQSQPGCLRGIYQKKSGNVDIGEDRPARNHSERKSGERYQKKKNVGSVFSGWDRRGPRERKNE